MAQAKDKDTKPELRERIKEALKASDKGGKPGQWSARKSQLLVQEYERQGGGYTTAEKDEVARSLEHWTEQDWQTIDGSANARADDTTRRYLPKAVWQRLSDEEKREAERTKTTKSKAGEQYVPWTPAIRRAFKDVEGGGGGSSTKQELYEQAKRLGIPGRSRMSKAQLRKAVANASD